MRAFEARALALDIAVHELEPERADVPDACVLEDPLTRAEAPLKSDGKALTSDEAAEAP